MSIYDAQLNNKSDSNVRQYVDLDLFFGKKTSNRDISDVTDVQAVKRSIRNLVLLNSFENKYPQRPLINGSSDLIKSNLSFLQILKIWIK